MADDPQRGTFLRELCQRHQDLVVWKHLDRALEGRGDIDAATPAGSVRQIAATAVDLACHELGASSVIRCSHVAGKTLLFFVRPAFLPQLFELDLCRQPSRASAPWADPRRLLELAVDDDGIRRLRPGAEAVVSLVYHGLSAGGHARLAGDERAIVRHGLAVDLAGAIEACALLPPAPARAPLTSLTEELARGTWSRGHAAAAWFGFMAGALGSPGHAVGRTISRVGQRLDRDCVMSRLARHHGRRVPMSIARLLQEARDDGHDVREVGTVSAREGPW